jgi:leucine dehydrogenase
MDIKGLIESWGGLGVVSRYEPDTEAWIFIALHDDTLGTPTGGTRMQIYPTPEDGLRDAMRLSEGMTHKWGAIDLPFGGGKAVLALARELDADERAQLLTCYARLLNSLHGSFATGLDLGTTEDDMVALAEHTTYVHGVDRENRVAKDPGPYTALGVLAAIRATAARRFGVADLSGRTALIQGLGHVGAPLARLLAEKGARLILSDLDDAKAGALASELGGEAVRADRVYDTAADLFVPCALGAILNEQTIERLRCAAIAGSANNQLAEPSDAEALHRRGILYAPDYIANAGGALAFGLMHLGVTDEAELRRRLEGIGTSLKEVFEEAGRQDETPLAAAQRRVRRTLERARRDDPEPGRRP